MQFSALFYAALATVAAATAQDSSIPNAVYFDQPYLQGARETISLNYGTCGTILLLPINNVGSFFIPSGSCTLYSDGNCQTPWKTLRGDFYALTFNIPIRGIICRAV